jgi:chromosome partitioning protein
MRTIALVSTKGGTGKSTLAASLGVAAMQAGEKPYLIDLDPQGSLASWGGRRRQDDPPVDRIEAAKLVDALAGLARAGFSLAIIDTAGRDDVVGTAAMRAADLALIPARPSTLDLEATRPTLNALARLDRPFAFVLNACPAGRSARLDDAGRALALLGALAEPPIAQRTDHADALGLGLGVSEFNPEGKAAQEISALWAWIRRRMEPQTNVETSVA